MTANTELRCQSFLEALFGDRNEQEINIFLMSWQSLWPQLSLNPLGMGLVALRIPLECPFVPPQMARV